MTAVEKLEISLLGIISFDSEELRAKYKERIATAKEIEKQKEEKYNKMLEMLKEFVKAIEDEEIIIKENFDNDGFENCGNRLYNEFKQLIKEATEI